MSGDSYGTDAFAIVGLGCRLPGGIVDLAGLWEALGAGRDLVGAVPEDRFESARFVDTAMPRPGKSYTARGGFLADIAGFDAEYFGISPREAAQMDPQHRLLLETAVEALDDAGIDPARLAGSDTCVFVGVSDFSYGGLQMVRARSMNAYSMAGTAHSIAANRLSHFFDLRGPSMAVDTACSSSLVAVERACRELASGGSRVALAGGVNVLLNPAGFVGFSQASMLSKRGRCAAFSAHADGFVRAEGAGVVVLKPLADALGDGDRIHGVIAGAGSNCDGHTVGLALPSARAQEDLLRRVYERAGIAPDEVGYVEAHGTGTQAGDPAECTALGQVLGVARTVGPLPIGSVKSNVGHLEPASGMAGLFKALAVLRYGTIPASLHLDPLNPGIDFAGLGLEPVDRARPLASGGRRRFVGVNSFGFGGANAHVVVGPPPAVTPPSSAVPQPGPDTVGELPVIASGRTPQAAEEAARRLAARLTAGTRRKPTGAMGPTGSTGATESLASAEFYDIAATTAVRRARHRYRRVALASSPHEAARILTDDAVTGEAVEHGRVGLVFAGNGSQWAGMAADLLDADPVFGAEVESVDAALAPRIGWSVAAQLRRPADEWGLEATEVAQPLLFAVQAGIVAVLRERGVRWTAALGHSVGEVAAAYAVGALTLQEAAWVVAERGRAQAATAGRGRMAAVGLPSAEAERVLSAYPGLVVAAVNSARDVTIAGHVNQLKSLGEELTAREVFFRLMDLDYAFHSPVMERVRAPLAVGLEGLAPDGSTEALISTVTGGPVPASGLDAEYWWRNVREPVRFAAAVDHALDAGVDVLLEVGPHPALRTYLRRITAGRDRVAVLGTLRRDAAGPAALRRSVEALIAAGAETDWTRWFPRPARVVELPAYPWQRERHWSGTPQQWIVSSGSGRLDHPLLGERLPTAEPSWHGPVEPVLVPWLADHKVAGSVVLPATGYVEMGLSAGRRVLDGPVELAWLEVSRPLVVPWDRAGDVHVQLGFSPDDGMVSITSTEAAAGTDADGTRPRPHARCRVRELIGRPPARIDLTAVRARCTRRADVDTLYPELAATGLDYGPAFRQLARLHIGDGEVLAAYRHTTDAADTAQYVAHPALLDGALQACVPLVAARAGAGQCWLPAAIGAVRVWRSPSATGMLHVRDRTRGAAELCFDITVTDPDGSVTAELDGVRMRRVPGPADRAPLRYETVLRAAPHPHLPAAPSPLPANHELATAAAGSVDALEAGWRATRFADFTARLKLVTAHVAAAAFGDLLPADVAEFTPADLVRQGMLPGYERLARALLGLMAGHGLAAAGEDGRWRLTGAADPGPLLAGLPSDFPACSAEVRLAVRQLSHLPQVLRGEHDALQLLTGQGSQEALEQFYDVAPTCRFHNRVMASLAAQIARAWPEDRPLRILEIGGGTGGTAAAVLPLLPPERTVYHFTDVSAGFFARARHRFGDHDFVDYRPFDLNADPAEQGFGDGAYDLVVAANSLHTASDLGAALRRVRGLLAPGGRLLAFETHDTDYLLPFFGTLDSFWRHDDELRPDSPLLSRDQWTDLLPACGLADVVCLGGDIASPARDGGSVLLATAPSPETAQPALPRPVDGTRWIVATESGSETPLAEHLTALLADGGRRSVPVTPAPVAPAVWTASLTGDGDPAVVLVLGDSPADSPTDSPAAPQAMLDQAVRRAATLRALAAACRNLPDGARPALWLVTRPSGALPAPERAAHPQDAAAWGMARTLANEHPGLRVTRLSLERLGDPAADAHRLARELLAPAVPFDDDEEAAAAREDEVVLTSGGRFLPRERAVPSDEHVEQSGDEPFALRIRTPGLSYEPVWTRTRPLAPGAGEVVIAVRAAALNYRDIMQATGLLPPEAGEGAFGQDGPGLECAGIVTAVGEGVGDLAVGDRVCAAVPACLASHTVAPAAAVVKIPDGLGFAAAATLPVAFLTVHYALHDLARLAAGETVLVHGAAGGVGLAAVQYARLVGATVIATAGSPAKRDLLRALGVEHVLDSRSLDFAGQALRITAGRGVDVVLNSLAGQAIDRGLETLRPGGRFVELGKRDIYANKPLLMRPFSRNIAFFGVDVTALLGDEAGLEHGRRLLAKVAERVADGRYRPLPHTVYPAARVGEAFTLLQHSRHIGKVVVSLDPQDGPVPVRTRPEPPRLDPDGTYLVTGGLSGFGAATARRLADRGARHLALVSRRGADGPEATDVLSDLAALGVTVTPYAADVTDAAAMAEVIGRVDATGHRLTGVVHAAMTLDDAPLTELTDERIRAVLAPKMAGAAVLDALTRDHDLRLFWLYSSFTAAVGNVKQSAYVGGNLFTEALARRRHHAARPALAVAWGALGDCGHVAREGLAPSMEALGTVPLGSREALAALETLAASGACVAGVGRYDWARLRAFLPALTTPRFAALLPADGDPGGHTRQDLVAALAGLTSEEALQTVGGTLAEYLAQILQTDAARLDPKLPLQDYGVDSLMAAELLTTLRQRLDVEIPPLELLQGGVTVTDLARHVLLRLGVRTTDTANG
ncbi:SDR family NAD(P)-dependent oxidoreductase [Streptomyces sp. DT2A-34]|uniref:type I polyketide synthase n=1 Tax=Streptomyces sp. DT2A-34 TaxID=3051182 RepID=UPI00265B7AA4|nr:type I polyketide synthase [Streptomyces sp. DT2A-34]MDO0910633.1 SDR family NAD(P)-dependent oxidoreductase [Streptomyces sp. DT2A-34]